MSLVQDLEEIIRKTGSYKDREILLKVLEQLKKQRMYNGTATRR